MTTLYEFTKKNSTGKGEDMMWKTVQLLSDSIEQHYDEKEKSELMRSLHDMMLGKHYDECYAMQDVEKMYYTDEDGKKHYAPYWTEEQVRQVYETVKTKLPKEYNFWDFYVTLQMVKSDNYALLKAWFTSDESVERDKKFIQMAINWLNDPDNPYGDAKIWGYLN